MLGSRPSAWRLVDILPELSLRHRGRARRWRCLTLLVLTLGVGSPTLADSLKGRWSLGGSLSYLVTPDDIRSNAALSVGPSSGSFSCFDAQLGAHCDIRPDSLQDRKGRLEDDLSLSLTLGYGMSEAFSLQLDLGYFRSELGPVDAYLESRFPAPLPGQPRNLALFSTVGTSFPASAGRITEVPVTVSGVLRFLRDKRINPYLGLGGGRLFTEVETNRDILELNQRIDRMRVRSLTDEAGRSLGLADADGRLPLQHPVTLNVDDAGIFQLMAGAEWFLSRRSSLVLDARYTVTRRSVRMDLAGEDQVNFEIFPEELFRPDGSVRIFIDSGSAPNPLCAASNSDPAHGCDPQDQNFDRKRVTCQPGEFGDFDGDGNQGGQGGPDLCYSVTLPGGPARGELVVQGGEIELTGFSLNVGLRFHF